MIAPRFFQVRKPARRAIPLVVGVVAIGLGTASDVRAQATRPSSAPDFVVAYLYEARDPVATFQSKAYDCRKGEYQPKALAAWQARMKADHPGVVTYLRSIILPRRPGRTETQELAEAIAIERARVVEWARSAKPNPVANLAGSRWGFRPGGPVVYEFLEGGKLRHRTTSRQAEGGWTQQGSTFSLWVGPSREQPDFTFAGKVRNDRLEGTVTSRTIPEAREPRLQALRTENPGIILRRIAPRAPGRGGS